MIGGGDVISVADPVYRSLHRLILAGVICLGFDCPRQTPSRIASYLTESVAGSGRQDVVIGVHTSAEFLDRFTGDSPALVGACHLSDPWYVLKDSLLFRLIFDQDFAVAG